MSAIAVSPQVANLPTVSPSAADQAAVNPLLQLSAYDYELPPQLIAQQPASPRDHSRLLVALRQGQALQDCRFDQLPRFLQAGDVLVLNDTKVFKARLQGTKRQSQGRVEVFLLKYLEQYQDSGQAPQAIRQRWQVLLKPGRRINAQTQIDIAPGFYFDQAKKQPDGSFHIDLNLDKGTVSAALDKYGQVPLPPYIQRSPGVDAVRDARRYQTIYAHHKGSVAAPTAGLHFTDQLLKACRAMGVQTTYITLHVGLGTFKPVDATDISQHQMHQEEYRISAHSARTINAALREGRRVICVGTTSMRTLESAFMDTEVRPGRQETGIFIYPGYQFRVASGLVTNFHLPKSTLLMLVAAYMGYEPMRAVYAHAIAAGYRFYSYGDAMLIL